MVVETNIPWYTSLQKKYTLVVAACVAFCVLGASIFVCMLEYRKVTNEILRAQEESLTVWVDGTVSAVSLWSSALGTQSRRVSSSELYRLFATEISQSSDNTAAVINDPDAAAFSPSDETSVLSEQVPLMRNVLLDFMNYNGLMDVRLVNGKGQILLSSLARPTPLTTEQQLVVAQALDAGTLVFAAVRPSSYGLALDFADPVTSVLAQGNVEKPVAALLISLPVTGPVAQFLARDTRQTGAVQPHIVQKKGNIWEDIRVQATQPVPFYQDLSPHEESGIMPFALRSSPQGDVFSLGKRVPELGWWIVLEIPASQISKRLDSEAWVIFGIGILGSVGFLLLLALLWWVSVGCQQRAVAEKFEQLYQVIKRNKQLLDSVNVSLDVGLFLSRQDGEIQVCNRAFAQIVKKEESALLGMSLVSLFDSKIVGLLLEKIRQVIDSNQSVSFELDLSEGSTMRLFRVTLFPFVDDSEEQDSPDGAVGILQDITEFRRHSEQNKKQQANTIMALVRAIEGVDPYLSGHSQLMETLANLVGVQMQLGEKDCATLRTAASLSQVGKIFVPRELLTKAGGLTEAELLELNRVPEYAAHILQNIDFGLPIAETVYQMYEHMDGNGHPRGLNADEISIHARVLAVVNAFCAMVSPRSYRSKMPVDEAIRALRADTGTFDQDIVSALEQVLHTPEGAQATMDKDKKG